MKRNNNINIHSQRGDIPIGQILIIGAIVIPLVVVLVMFRDDLIAFFLKAYLEIVKIITP